MGTTWFKLRLFHITTAKCFAILSLFLILLNACAIEEQKNSNLPNAISSPDKDQITGVVISLHDGDTIWIFDGAEKTKIRLAGIDAPESDQPFGQKSKQFLSNLVLNKTITIYTHKTDLHGRPVGKIICDGNDVNLELLKAGLAWHYKQYQNEQSPTDRSAYADAEAAARTAKLGLWIDANPIPPWEWRHGKDEENIRSVPEGSIIGNKNSMIYHTPGCSTYGKVSPQNQVIFKNIQEAEEAGFRRAKNCKGG